MTEIMSDKDRIDLNLRRIEHLIDALEEIKKEVINGNITYICESVSHDNVSGMTLTSDEILMLHLELVLRT